MNHKQCRLVPAEFLPAESKRRGKKNYQECKYCLDHKIIVCRCGEEFGKHPKPSLLSCMERLSVL